MFSFFEASLDQISVHSVGNKVQDEFYILSDQTLNIDDHVLKNLLIKYFLSPFEKGNEVYYSITVPRSFQMKQVFMK
jgi:hypothetical protein